MTFLEICQAAVQESGTVGGDNLPASVTGQSGRMADFVRWVKDGWIDIQNHRPSWRWMRDEFEEEITTSASRYSGDDFGLTRFGTWAPFDEDGRTNVTMFKTSLGATDERSLIFRRWDDFYKTALAGPNRTKVDRPSIFTIDPQDRLVFWPAPDATYTVRGIYRKTPQILAANGDIPEMPVRFHGLITYAALLKLGQYDEALNQIPGWLAEYRRRLSELMTDQMPGITLSGPLA